MARVHHLWSECKLLAIKDESLSVLVKGTVGLSCIVENVLNDVLVMLK